MKARKGAQNGKYNVRRGGGIKINVSRLAHRAGAQSLITIINQGILWGCKPLPSGRGASPSCDTEGQRTRVVFEQHTHACSNTWVEKEGGGAWA